METWKKELKALCELKPLPILKTEYIQESLLDNRIPKPHHEKPRKWHKNKSWNKKQKRCYMKALSGVKRYFALNKFIFHLTLTSSKRSTDIRRHWDNLVKRVRRELDPEFQYLKVETKEGNGVIHAIICMDSYFWKYHYSYYHAYFSTLWNELHEAPNVWVSVAKRKTDKSARDLCRYLITQYVAGQSFIRMSRSKYWCFKGFYTRFRQLLKKYGFANAKHIWNCVLKTKNLNIKTLLPIYENG